MVSVYFYLSPFVVFLFEGNTGVFLPGSGYYRALYPKPPAPESIQDCSTTGVLSSFVGWVGMHQAMLAVQLALDLIKDSVFYFLDGRKTFRKNHGLSRCYERCRQSPNGRHHRHH